MSDTQNMLILLVSNYVITTM